MKIYKTNEEIDLAVAKCESVVWDCHYKPSSNWEQSGHIIEREKISLEWTGEDWMAFIWHDQEFFGETPLIAAMRCYVINKMTVEVTA